MTPFDFAPPDLLTAYGVGMPRPLDLPDSWIGRSALHKAIRRGEAELAARAALFLLHADPVVLWKRLAGIAVEDVGLGDPQAMLLALAATSAKWRKAAGGDNRVAPDLAMRLAGAVKDRSTDNLAGAAANHPDLEGFRAVVRSLTVGERIRVAKDARQPLHRRAVAHWHASGVDFWRLNRVGPGDLVALLEAHGDQGVSPTILAATAMGVRKVREPIFTMPPLLAQVIMPTGIIPGDLTPMTLAGDLPLPALDMFTRTGKRAIARFAFSNPELACLLNDTLPARSWPKAVGVAVFYAEGGGLDRRLDWTERGRVERMGMEADFAGHGIPQDVIDDLLAVVGQNIPHLNHLRRRLSCHD